MSNRKSLVITLWLTSSLTLLASVLVAPSWSSRCFTVSSRPDSLRREFALPPNQPTFHLAAALTTDADFQGNALASESEEQDRADAREEPRVSFLIPCTLRQVPDRQPISPRSIISLYPLRC